MEYKITIQDGRESKEFLTDGQQTLLELLRGAGAQVEAPCGGNGTCGQCGVAVTGPCRFRDGEVLCFAEETVLSCRARPAGDLVIRLDRARGERVLTDAIDIPPSGEGLGLAVDIGTTTVAAYLYDLTTGKCLAARGAMNAQRTWGGDVISRIQHARSQEGLNALTQAIREQLAALAGQLCEDPGKIRYVSIAGNTVMEHLFAGLSPESIGIAPFRPLSLFGQEHPAAEYMDCFASDCVLYLCPAVAGYVGGDITAGLVSSGAAAADKLVLFIDIGTNGEMGLGNRQGFLCCATAAGPAFEGAEIECGTPARDGAVSAVETDLSYTVLGDTEAKSLCGSGLIDLTAALLYNGILDETGRMEQERYSITDSVWLSGKDVRKLQLAKAAVRAGIETLLERSGKRCEDIDEVLIAGGFGAYMRLQSACAIGMLPPDLLNKARHVGNSAGKGAALALTPAGREALQELHRLCRYEELSSSALFNDNYIEAMLFDEWEEAYD